MFHFYAPLCLFVFLGGFFDVFREYRMENWAGIGYEINFNEKYV